MPSVRWILILSQINQNVFSKLFFSFSTETKFEITRELHYSRVDLETFIWKEVAKMFDFQKCENLSEKIETIIETNDNMALSFVSDIIKERL